LKRAPALGPRKQGPRARVLQQWRGVDLGPMEIARELRAKQAGKCLPKILADLGLDRRRSDAEIIKVWNSALDPEIVRHAQPTGLRKGTLFVSVDTSVWLSEIVRFRQKEILERLRHSFGSELIRKISFRIG